jgi:hypothetical protein
MSKGELTIIEPDGTRKIIPLDDEPDLEVVQEAVGGFIELVPGFNTIETERGLEPCLAFVNEEGKLDDRPQTKNMTLNLVGTVLLRRAIGRGRHPYFPDQLVGPVAIITGAEVLKKMAGP